MINWLNQISIGKVITINSLLLAGLWWTSAAMADQWEDDLLLMSESGFEIVMLDETELLEGQLGTVRGHGVDRVVPAAQLELSVILWDEGGVKKGTRSAPGYSNSVVTVEVYLEGR